MSPAASTKSLSYQSSASQEEFAHPHSLKIRSFLGDSHLSLRKDRFYRTAPILPKPRGPQRQVFVDGVETVRGPQQQVLVAGVETPDATKGVCSPLDWNLPSWLRRATGPCRNFPAVLGAGNMNPVFWNPPHSLPEPGGLPCLLSSVCSLDVQSGFWASSAS